MILWLGYPNLSVCIYLALQRFVVYNTFCIDICYWKDFQCRKGNRKKHWISGPPSAYRFGNSPYVSREWIFLIGSEVETLEVAAFSHEELNDSMEAEKFTWCKVEHVSEGFLVSNIEEHVASLGQSFVGSIVLFEEISVMITSFDALVHVANLNDCSFDNKRIGRDTFAKLHRKLEKKARISLNFPLFSTDVSNCLLLVALLRWGENRLNHS